MCHSAWIFSLCTRPIYVNVPWQIPKWIDRLKMKMIDTKRMLNGVKTKTKTGKINTRKSVEMFVEKKIGSTRMLMILMYLRSLFAFYLVFIRLSNKLWIFCFSFFNGVCVRACTYEFSRFSLSVCIVTMRIHQHLCKMLTNYNWRRNYKHSNAERSDRRRRKKYFFAFHEKLQNTRTLTYIR